MLGIIKNFFKERRKKVELRKKILSEELSYNETAENITKSISYSNKLYKELITKTHPDLFESEKKAFATELSAEITKNKKNYNELLRLKKIVEDFLQIKQK